MMKRVILLILICLSFNFTGKANNVVINNVGISNDDITFDLSWENSWKDAVNYDAVWVFIKYRMPNSSWEHATLNATGHNIPAGALLEQPQDNKGVFVYRDAIGSGTNTFNGFSLSWNHNLDGISNTANIQVKVIGIEVVKVPTAPYYAAGFKIYGASGPLFINDQPTVVYSKNFVDDAIIRGTGVLLDGDDGIDVDGNSIIDNPGYPTGYKGFYLMKYEISQEQYADFLNTLDYSQAINRLGVIMGNVYPLSGAHPNITAQAPEHAMSFLSWSDGCAYADWAALRPMTELEFEKGCRGPLYPVTGEFAWGTANISSTPYTVANFGADNESITNPAQNSGNALYGNTAGSNIEGPLRCGIFAASAINASREETGASYYGAMEMSGNAYERCVNLGNVEGRSFDGSHGDGSLTTDGFSDNSGWPGFDGVSVTGAVGSGLRGGGFYYWIQTLQVSSRIYATSANNARHNSLGFRAVRTAN